MGFFACVPEWEKKWDWHVLGTGELLDFQGLRAPLPRSLKRVPLPTSEPRSRPLLDIAIATCRPASISLACVGKQQLRRVDNGTLLHCLADGASDMGLAFYQCV